MNKDYTLLDEWVKEAKAGDQKAVEMLLHTFQPLMLSMVQKYIYQPADYEDGLQEASVVLMETLKAYQFELGVPFPFYLKNRLFHYFVELAKKNAKEKERQSFVEDEDLNAQQERCAGESRAALREEEVKSARYAQLEKALKELTPEQREVIERRYYKGESIKAIAEKKGVSVITIEKRRAAGIRRLKKIL